MKKLTRKKQGLFERKIVFIFDKNLNKLKAEDLAPEKLAMANEHLRKMKSLPYAVIRFCITSTPLRKIYGSTGSSLSPYRNCPD